MTTYTAEHLASLEAALASGALRVKDGERDVTYRSVAELREAIATVKAQIGAQPRVTHYQPVFERGY